MKMHLAVTASAITMASACAANAQQAAVELELSYDQMGRVRTVKDGNAVETGGQGSTFYAPGMGLGAYRDPAGGTVRITYDTDDRPIAQADELNRVTRSTYDAHGRVTSRTYPELNRVEFDYDDRSNVTLLRKVAKPGSPEVSAPLTVRAAYDTTWNKPLWIKDARGYQTDFTYYPAGGAGAGQVATQTMPADSNGQRPVYAFTYNAYGQVATSTDPTNVVTQNTYATGAGRYLLTTTLDPGGVGAVTTFATNAAGDVISVDGPRTDVVDVSLAEYDEFRRKTYEAEPNTGADTPATRTFYDYSGKVLEVQRGKGTSAVFTALLTETYEYDASGNRIRTTTPAGVTQASFDALNRPVCTAIRVNTSTYTSLPDACSPTALGGFGRDQITRNTYDLAGQLTKVEMGVGAPEAADFARYGYSAGGLKESVTDANNNRTVMTYDGFDRVKQLRYPVTTRGAASASTTDYEEYGYDANGNRTSLRKRDGQVIAFQYDALNRMIVKDLPGGSTADVYTEYDRAGRPLSARFSSAGGSGVIYTYDTAGRAKTEATFGRTLYSDYDKAGNRTKLTWGDGYHADYVYDAANRLSQVRENGATTGAGLLASFTYGPLNQRSRLDRGNGTRTDYAYDVAGRPSGVSNVAATPAQSSYQTLSYSPASQVATLQQTNASYVWSGQPTSTKSYTHDGLNRDAAIAALGGGYDARGNLTADGQRTFTYDVENRLTSSSGGGASMALSYDPLGRLFQVVSAGTTTQFLYDGTRLVGEYSGTSTAPLRRYVHGGGVDEPLVWYEGSGTTDRRWLHADRQGSTIAVTNGAGSATIYTYGPYGEPQDWQGSRFRYTGQIALPEAQLYHYKARVYDPVMGRFLQTDPIGQQDDLNLYAYVKGDASNKTDPTGQCTLPGVAQLCAGVGGAALGAVIEVGRQVVIEQRSLDNLDRNKVAQEAAIGFVSAATGSGAGALVAKGGVVLSATVAGAVSGGVEAGVKGEKPGSVVMGTLAGAVGGRYASKVESAVVKDAVKLTPRVPGNPLQVGGDKVQAAVKGAVAGVVVEKSVSTVSQGACSVLTRCDK